MTRHTLFTMLGNGCLEDLNFKTGWWKTVSWRAHRLDMAIPDWMKKPDKKTTDEKIFIVPSRTFMLAEELGEFSSRTKLPAADRVVEKVRDCVGAGKQFLQDLATYGDASWDDEVFRSDLKLFLDNLDLVATTMKTELAGKMCVDDDWLDLASSARRNKVIDEMPSFLLRILDLSLRPYKNWKAFPADLKARLDEPDPAKIRCNKLFVKVGRIFLQGGLVILPKDLSFTLSLVGEGGGTECAGHPVTWVMQYALLVCDLADLVFEERLATQ